MGASVQSDCPTGGYAWRLAADGDGQITGFFSALDAQRRSRGLNWKQVASEAGVSASTLTRMGQGRRPDVDGLAALAGWSGLDAGQFVIGTVRGKPEPLTMVSTYLRSDPNLTPESADALDAVIKATYETLRKKKSGDAS